MSRKKWKEVIKKDKIGKFLVTDEPTSRVNLNNNV